MSDFVDNALMVNEDKRMTEDELLLIEDFHNTHYKGGNTLEIGAYKGMTSNLLVNLMNAYPNRNPESRHYIVDLFNDGIEDDWNYEEYSRELLIENLDGLKDLAVVHKGASLSEDSIQMIVDKKFDFVFIDGDHRYGTLLMELYMTNLVTDHITGHDYGHKGVSMAVDRFINETGYKLNHWKPPLGLFSIEK